MVAGDDGREVDVEQVGCGVALAHRPAASSAQPGIDLGPHIGQSEAGREIPAARPGVPGLEHRGQRERHFPLQSQRSPAAQGDLPAAADVAVQVDLREVDRPDGFRGNNARIGLHVRAGDLAAQRAFGGPGRARGDQ
ncbi:hypothetical protein D3C85_1275290 [compost metagenome]